MGYPALLYRHTLDQEAFEALNHFPRFIGLCEAYIANVDEVAAKLIFCQLRFESVKSNFRKSINSCRPFASS